MGDTIDNVKGVPGIGEKGARDLIATYGTLDALLERAAEVPQKKYREALPPTPTKRAEPRAAADSHERAGRVRHHRVPLPRADAGSVLRALLRAGFPLAGDGVRAHRRHDREGLPRRRHAGRRRASSPRELKAAGRFALRVLPDGSGRGPGGHRRPVVLNRSPAGVVRADWSRRALRSDVRADPDRVGLPETWSACLEPLRDRGGRCASALCVLCVALCVLCSLCVPRRLKPVLEDPSIEKVGHDLKFDLDRAGPPRHHARRTRHGHHAGELPARFDADRASARGHRARASQLQGAHRGGRVRPGREGREPGVRAGRDAAQLRG